MLSENITGILTLLSEVVEGNEVSPTSSQPTCFHATPAVRVTHGIWCGRQRIISPARRLPKATSGGRNSGSTDVGASACDSIRSVKDHRHFG